MSTVPARAAAAALLAAALSPLLATAASAAPVVPADVVVYRVGDGSAALSSAASAVFLDEYSLAGTAVQSLPLPTTATGTGRRVTASGSATSEGLLTQTADGTALLATGYDAAPGTTGVASTTSASVNRVVARLTANGLVDSSTVLTDAPTGNNVRSASAAASAAGAAVTVAGGAGGLRGTTFGAQGTSTALNTDLANVRQVESVDGKTFLSTSSGSTVRLGYLNGGAITPLPGLPTSTSPYSFALLDLVPGRGYAGGTVDTLYVADDTPGTITKYAFDGTTWNAAGSASVPSARGLAAKAVGTSVQLVATTGTTLVSLTDTSGAAGTLTGTPATLAAAPANEAFRGVAFAPTAAVVAPPVALPEVSATALLPLAGLGALGAVVRLRRRRSVA